MARVSWVPGMDIADSFVSLATPHIHSARSACPRLRCASWLVDPAAPAAVGVSSAAPKVTQTVSSLANGRDRRREPAPAAWGMVRGMGLLSEYGAVRIPA